MYLKKVLLASTLKGVFEKDRSRARTPVRRLHRSLGEQYLGPLVRGKADKCEGPTERGGLVTGQVEGANKREDLGSLPGLV